MTAILFSLCLPLIVGILAFAIDYGVLLVERHKTQNAADSAAFSAAVAIAQDQGALAQTQAVSVAASQGYAPRPGLTISVNRPPTSGAYVTNSNAVEVIIQEQTNRIFSALLGSSSLGVKSRAVALPRFGNGVCVLALDPTASSSVNVQGSDATVLNGCSVTSDSNSSSSLSVGGTASLSADTVYAVGGVYGEAGITTTDGVYTGQPYTPDPYSNLSVPSFSGCTANNYSTATAAALSPGVYCGGIKLTGNADVSLGPGTYILDQGALSVAGGATLTGDGVTLIFTSSTGSNYAIPKIGGGAVVNLTAPSSGAYAGIVMFGDRRIPIGTGFNLGGGSQMSMTGAVYAPTSGIQYDGNTGTSGCTQIIGDTITFTGSSSLAMNCGSLGLRPISSSKAVLVE